MLRNLMTLPARACIDRRGAGGGGYSPLTAFGAALFAWYDASVAGSMFQDDAGTVPAGNTDTVGQWRDLSGNSNHATQATSSARPSRSGSTLMFGGDDRLVCAAFAGGTKAQVWTAVVVGAASNNNGAFFDSAAPRILMQRGASATAASIHAGATYAPGATPDVSVRRAIYGEYAGASSVLRVNNSPIGAAGNAGTNGAGNVSLGGIPGNLLIGELDEVLFISRATTVPERLALQLYLAAKWGL